MSMKKQINLKCLTGIFTKAHRNYSDQTETGHTLEPNLKLKMVYISFILFYSINHLLLKKPVDR